MPKLEVWANLPVADVAKTKTFYNALGFKVNHGDPSPDLASYRFSDDHFVIHFFRADLLEKSMGQRVADTSVGSEIIFTIGAENKKAVDEWREKVARAGGTIHIEPAKIPEGYYFVFADPDGHRWNVFAM